MAKILNLLGIRKKAILCRTKVGGNPIYTVMRPITEQQKKELDDNERLVIDNITISKDNIYCYGEFNVNNDEDLNYIKKFNIINLDEENSVHSNLDFETGEVTLEGNIAKVYCCYDAIKWFKYQYLLIGKPNRIIVYKCPKHDL